MIGRHDAQLELERLCESPRSEFAVVYGRRRVGKTYLVREFFGYEFAFYATGVAGGNLHSQLLSFNKSLREYGGTGGAASWFEAFDQLEALLSRDDVHREEVSGKRVVFIDEMPWLDTARSEFLMALELFWNRWASAQNDLLLIACGSASSWMVKNLFKNRGGLHNRVTSRIHLDPFTLGECEEYYKANGMPLTRYQVIQSYMVFGGIPYYLDLMHRRLGLAQNIDRLCFARNGALKGEFDELYQSLFRNADRHERIVRALSAKPYGLSRDEVSMASGIANGGTLTATLEELEQCGFIRGFKGLGKRKNGTSYRLIDPFSLFYLRFMEEETDEHFWSSNVQSPRIHAWEGYAFETVCLRHLEQIRAALGIAGVSCSASAWKSRKADPGAQIDLVIDRADGVIDICEMKFTMEPFAVDKAYDANLRHKICAFSEETETRKTLQLVLINPYGMKRNMYSDVFQTVLDADGLFR